MEKKINIEDMIESIVFDKDNLSDLKNALKKARTGESSIKELGMTILELRVRILKALQEFIPFHLKLMCTNTSLEEFTNPVTSAPRIEQELEEKNVLLETISSRIKRIFETLNSISDKENL